MKCSIIRDLLPLYCDKLTSEDSNEEIEKHLRECEECNNIYESMNNKEDDIKADQKDIKPLKKIKKRIKLKVIAAIIGTLAVLSAVFVFAFVGVIPISSDKLHYTAKIKPSTSYYWTSDTIPDDNDGDGIPDNAEAETSNVLWIEFSADCSCARYETDYTISPSASSQKSMTVYPQIKLPFDDRGKNPSNFDYGLGNIEEGDILTVHCRDKDVIIDLWQLWLDTKAKEQ